MCCADCSKKEPIVDRLTLQHVGSTTIASLSNVTWQMAQNHRFQAVKLHYVELRDAT